MDIRTIIIMLGAGNLLITALLYAYVKNSHEQAIHYHLMGQLALTLSYPAILLREIAPLALSAIGSAAAFMIGALFEAFAVYAYLGTASNRLKRTQIGLTVLIIAAFTFVTLSGSDTDLRVIIVSAGGVLQLMFPALMLIRHPQKTRLQWLLGLLHLLVVCAFALRVAYAMDPRPMTSVYEDNVGQVMTFIGLYAYMLICGSGLILLFKEKEDKELFRAATWDSLTGIRNRSRFIEEAEHAISYCSRKQVSYAVLMIDLDHFKRVNDRYGHDRGDAVLKHFAVITEALLRSYDIFGRFGGEEFIVLLQSVDRAMTEDIAERIRAAIEASPADGIAITVSIGAVTVSATDKPADFYQLYHLSDNALYEAKKSGRNRVMVVDAP